MSALQGWARLPAGLVAGGISMGAGVAVARAVGPSPLALVAGAAAALALALGWLLARPPLGGGLGWRRVLTPDPGRTVGPGLLMLSCWTLGAALLSMVTVGAVIGFDLDAAGWRPASWREVGGHALLGLLLAGLHGALCLSWGMGPDLGGGRDLRAVAVATAMAAGLAVLAGVAVAAPAVVVLLLAALVGLATAVMGIVVLVGGRVWPLVLANAFAWTVPMLAMDIPVRPH